MTKTCKVCLTEKVLEDFKKNKSCLYGREGTCKKCTNAKESANRKDRLVTPEMTTRKKENIGNWRKNNKLHVLEYKQKYNSENKELIAEYNKKKWAERKDKRTEEYFEKHRAATLKSYHKNKEKWLGKLNERRQQLDYRLSQTLRARLRSALKRNYKNSSAVGDLGCTIGQLKTYLESKFKTGMTWENWGHNGWHIDHIKPLSSFDLKNPEQQKLAVHFTNLQPLWSRENLSKGSKNIGGIYTSS